MLVSGDVTHKSIFEIEKINYSSIKTPDIKSLFPYPLSNKSKPFSILDFPPVKTTIPIFSLFFTGSSIKTFFGKVLNNKSIHHIKPDNKQRVKKLIIFLNFVKEPILKKIK